MPKKISKSFAMLLVPLLLFAVSGCTLQKANNPTAVTTAVAGEQELKTTLELSGVLVPTQTVDVSSKISGQVINLGFNVGSAVKTGDILIQLDTEALKAQLMQAEAGLQSAEATAQSVQNQASLAKINLDAAQKLYERTKALYESGAVSQSQMDDTTDKLNIAKNQFDNASGPAQNQAQAAINTAQANIKNIRVQIDNATIKSPLDGIVTNQSVNVGAVVSPGVPVISIVDTSILKMKCTVTQDLLPLLSVDQETDIKIDSYPEVKFKGSISSIGPIAVSTGEVFPVEISIKNNGSLAAGLSAHASLDTKVSGVVVPSSSVLQNGGESCVFIIKDNIAMKRVVKTGLRNDNGTQILTGVNAGEIVAATNVNALTDKMPVNAN